MQASFLFFQSHPEYEADTLLREFQRDVRRYHAGERRNFPSSPRAASTAADGLRGDLATELGDLSRDLGPAPWWPTSVALYRNWLTEVAQRKQARPRRNWEIAHLQLPRQTSVEMAATP
jgi:homoserine O-succinyltransferase